MKELPPVTSQAPGCSVLQLRTFVERTCLAGHLKYFSKKKSIIDQVDHHFRLLMRGIAFWELDRTQSLFTALCMLILTRDLKIDDMCHRRCNLVVRFMQFVDCVSPMMVHQLLEKLLADLEEHSVDSEANILKVAVKLSDLGQGGRVFAVCLLWSVLGRRLPSLEITMHRFREPGELVEALKRTPPAIPDAWMSDENGTYLEVVKIEMDNLLVLLEAMALLLKLLVRCDNQDLLEEGYPQHFFDVEEGDCTYLIEWCCNVAKGLPDSLGGSTGRFGGPLHAIIDMLVQDRQEAPEANVEELMVEVEVALNLSDDG